MFCGENSKSPALSRGLGVSCVGAFLLIVLLFLRFFGDLLSTIYQENTELKATCEYRRVGNNDPPLRSESVVSLIFDEISESEFLW